jgi:hypothetical protein
MFGDMSISHCIVLVLVLVGGVRRQGLCQRKIRITQSGIEPATFRHCDTRSARLLSLYTARFMSQSTTENYGLLTSFDSLFTVFCYIRFVPIVLLDLSSCHLKSFVTVRVSLLDKKKVKCTLVQALRLCTGSTAHRGSRGIALLYRH